MGVYNGQMFSVNKNLKDSTNNSSITVKDSTVFLSYKKTDKLITALYIVTDIIDKEEPLRNKLRTLGTEIVSDIYSISPKAEKKIIEIMSFLDIASAINLISEMNYGILKKEFLELKQAVKEYTQVKPVWLEEFLRTDEHIGHEPLNNLKRTNIGVQKGSTLLKALSDKTAMSDIKFVHKNHIDFDLLKKERRFNIVNIIKDSGGSATIKDIKDKINNLPNGHNSTSIPSEKTLQRELISMVKENVLSKTGEKRWSRYSL